MQQNKRSQEVRSGSIRLMKDQVKEHIEDRRTIILNLGESMVKLETKCEHLKFDLKKKRLEHLQNFQSS